jgi:hypothetical protein
MSVKESGGSNSNSNTTTGTNNNNSRSRDNKEKGKEKQREMDDWEKNVHRLMALESEPLWAAAEAWIEAEAEAEEEEWRILQLGINSYGLQDDERRTTTRLLTGSPVISAAIRALNESPLLRPITPLSDFITPGDVSDHDDDLNNTSNHSDAGHYRVDHNSNILDVETIGDIHTTFPTAATTTVRSAQDGECDPEMTLLPSRAALDTSDPLRFHTPQPSTPPPQPSLLSISTSSAQSSGQRSLHAKLSSPDRRRVSLSPSAALKRLEEKQIAAEQIRDKRERERLARIALASQRVKDRLQREEKERESQREAERERLNEKLSHADERRQDYLDTIRGKASSENTKVSLSLSLLSSDTVAADLRSKLEEVEARILAANIRREQRLSDISDSQRKRQQRQLSLSSQQMSEHRLQLEQQKMERWEKLKVMLLITHFTHFLTFFYSRLDWKTSSLVV